MTIQNDRRQQRKITGRVGITAIDERMRRRSGGGAAEERRRSGFRTSFDTQPLHVIG